jgi:hypothetical protein
MADLLTHVLVVYVLLTVASWRIEAITARWITIGMAGAAIPDLIKVQLLLPRGFLTELVGIEVSLYPISTLGGVLLIAGAIAVFFERERPTAYAYLVVGGCTSLVVDGLRVFVTGRAGHWLYPFTWWQPPTPSLYVTSDPRVPAIAVAVSLLVLVVDRSIADAREESTETRQLRS